MKSVGERRESGESDQQVTPPYYTVGGTRRCTLESVQGCPHLPMRTLHLFLHNQTIGRSTGWVPGIGGPVLSLISWRLHIRDLLRFRLVEEVRELY